MMKKLVYISILSLLLLSSCRSKRVITVSLPQPIMQADSAQLGDTIGLPARLSPMFTFDQSDLRNVRRQPAKGRVKKQQIKKTAPVQKVIVQRGTRITSKTTHVGSAYKGVSRIKTYDFTHRDVPAAFEGFRIAFVSDLHYKSLLKEEGLKDLVRLLIDQKADVLLIGGDFHEGCQYVPPVMAALAQVKTPLGTYAVLGNNDYKACYDDIVREMRHYGMHLLEHKVDTLRRGGGRILVAGVRNPFDLGKNGISPTLGLSPDDFVILLTHTPDYAEDVHKLRPHPGRTHAWRAGDAVRALCTDSPLALRAAVPLRAEVQLKKYPDDCHQRHRHFAEGHPHVCPRRGGDDCAAPADRLIYSSGISTTPSFFLPSIFTTIGWRKCTCRRYFVSCTAGCAFRNSWL